MKLRELELNRAIRGQIEEELVALGLEELAAYATTYRDADQGQQVWVATDKGLFAFSYSWPKAGWSFSGALHRWQDVKQPVLWVEARQGERTVTGLSFETPDLRVDDSGQGLKALQEFADVCLTRSGGG